MKFNIFPRHKFYTVHISNTSEQQQQQQHLKQLNNIKVKTDTTSL